MAIHRGLTADQRRELRRHQLIQAALDAIAEDGVRNLRVRAISGRARLNDRYFYESFRDCQELLLAAFDDQFTLALSGIMATLSDAPLSSKRVPGPSWSSRSASSTRIPGGSGYWSNCRRPKPSRHAARR